MTELEPNPFCKLKSESLDSRHLSRALICNGPGLLVNLSAHIRSGNLNLLPYLNPASSITIRNIMKVARFNGKNAKNKMPKKLLVSIGGAGSD